MIEQKTIAIAFCFTCAWTRIVKKILDVFLTKHKSTSVEQLTETDAKMLVFLLIKRSLRLKYMWKALFPNTSLPAD